MHRLTVVAALALAFAGSGSAAAPAPAPVPVPGISVFVARAHFRISVLVDGRPLVSEDAAARLRFELVSNHDEYTLTRVTGVDGDRYQVATSEPGRSAVVTVVATSTGVRISASLRPAAGVLAVYDAFDTRPGEHFVGAGEQGQSVDLRGRILPIEVSEACSYAPVPFFASSAGWGLRLASENRAAFAFPGSLGGSGCSAASEPGCSFPPLPSRAEVCVQGASLDEDLYVGSLPHLLSDYEADSGRPAVPPRSELELVKWRDVVTGPGQVLDDITRFQAAQIPLGWVELDNPWEPCNGELTFDPARIPDPAQLIAQVHARGVRFMLWISPKATCSLGYPADGIIGPPSDRVLDFRNPAVVAVFQERLRRLFALGVDGVKADRGDEVDFDAISPSLTNEYPLLYARAVLAVMPRGDGGYFRAGTMGSQAILPGMWGGDQPGDWIGLQRAIVEAQTAGMSGFSTWGSDVGGYASEALTPAVFERWAQLGAVSPVMEVGGAGANATPWALGNQAMDVLRAAAVLHYELFPYLYGLLARRQPVLEPLAYRYPADPAVWAAPYELLVGPDLLAAPVTGPGVSPSVYLPDGGWVDLYTGRTVRGGGPELQATDTGDAVPALRARRFGAAIQPAYARRTPTGASTS